MSAPVRFLHSLANLLSTAGLYGPDHPSRQRALQAAMAELQGLLEADRRPVFSFMEDEVVYRSEPLRELKSWSWSRKLADSGIQRLELLPGLRAEELEGFLAEVARRLELRGVAVQPRPHPHIQYGTLGLRAGGGDGRKERRRGRDADAPPLDLADESQAIEWINEEASAGGRVSTTEAEAVVRGLSLAMHGVRSLVAPLIEIKSTDQYTTNHCINVSILAMSLAEYLKFADTEVRALGVAALLHDIGKTRIPIEILQKPGKLTEEERRVIELHTVEGARMLLAEQDRSILPAVVAYEHHMHWKGDAGYPERHYERRPHPFSRVVQICDVYDALRTRRPFRPPLSNEAALDFLREGAGTQFDPDLVHAFLEMVQQWEPPTVPAADDGSGEVIESDSLHRLAGVFDADIEPRSTAAV